MELTKLQMLLSDRKITQKQLVAMINEKCNTLPITANTLNRLVTGNRPDARVTTVYRICAALNVTPNDVLDFEFLG
jgi:DNA-binding Xre family transcriptional regulator